MCRKKHGILCHVILINANTVSVALKRLDKYWANQELLYDYRATLNTGNRKS